jgi:L-2,4-diaminobutyrate decarboxylase
MAVVESGRAGAPDVRVIAEPVGDRKQKCVDRTISSRSVPRRVRRSVSRNRSSAGRLFWGMPHDILAQLEADAAGDATRLFHALAVQYLAETRAGDGAVSTPRTAAELAERFREPLPRAGRALAEVAERFRRDVMADSNQLYHPMYMGHQVSAPLPAAVWVESVIGVLNQSVAVWEMSPTATVVEAQVIRWMCDLAGFGPAAGGTFTSGGTEATFAALLAARSRMIPDVWTNGIGERPPVVVCGEHAHYAVSRAVGEMGLGLRAAVTVPSREYRLDVARLAERLDALALEGTRVMAVVATAGSTATGAFDDLEAIAELCDARGLWLHVDGAHGASALLSGTHRHRVRGIERARSIAWDPHKMMLLPLSAGMILVREERELTGAFAQQAPYLFHAPLGEADEFDGAPPRVWDQGVRSFQCSRRADVLKVWVALQRYGADGIGALYDGLCETTRGLHDALGGRPEFVSLHAPEANILCFRFVGDGRLDDAALDAVNGELRDRYNRSGAGWITSTMLGGRRVLRVTVMNPRTTSAHTARLLDGLAESGRAVVEGRAGGR